MTKYEILTLAVSLLAVFVSAISLVRTRKIAAQQLDLEKITAELSRKQLEKIIESEENALKASVEVELCSSGDNNELLICNNGKAEANNVSIKVLGDYNPTISSDFESKVPIKSLRPGKMVSIIAVSEYGTPSSFDIEVTWENPNGEKCTDIQTVYE
ncbi:MAG: hypothetical protein WCT30_09220 [Desulfurivibrionaceae bacterium]|jgi:hypothetical protein